MRTVIGLAAALLWCGAAVAEPGLRCGAAEAHWSTDLAIAAKPAIDCATLGKIVDAFALLDVGGDIPKKQDQQEQAGGESPNRAHEKLNLRFEI